MPTALAQARMGRLIAIDIGHAMQAVYMNILTGRSSPDGIARLRTFMADLEKTVNDLEAADMPARSDALSSIGSEVAGLTKRMFAGEA